MTTHTTAPLLLEDLEDAGRTSGLAAGDRDALRAVADWIRDVVMPNAELGRPGPVCPFTPVSLQRQVLWLAPEHLGDGGVPRLVELLENAKRRLIDLAPPHGGGSDHGVIVVVLTDVSADRAPALFDGALAQIAVPSFVEDGILFGPFYDGHQGTAIYNTRFHPFQSPVPFVFVRYGVVDDWKFFLASDDMLGHWSRRFGEAATLAVAAELRQLPWNAPEQ
jgi:hypothetical protein